MCIRISPSLYSVKGLSVKPESIDYSYSKFDLNFWVEEANQELILSVTFPYDIFLKKTIQKLLINYKILLDSVISNPEEQCGILKYFPEEERSFCQGKRVEFKNPDTSLPATWIGEFKAQVRATPELIALRDIRRKLTYSELEQDSSHLANVLSRQGVLKGDLIGLFLPRNASLIISILGIFKTGAAYVPLDVHLPQERLKFIAKDAGLRLLISSEELSAGIPCTGLTVLSFEKAMAEPWSGDITLGDTGQGDLAYVIYPPVPQVIPKGFV